MNIINGLEISQGEKVLLHVFGDDTSYVEILKSEIENEGGEVRIAFRSRNEIAHRYKQNEKPDFSDYEWCDSAIDVFYHGIRPSAEFPQEKMDDYRTEMMTIMRMLMGKEKYIQLRMPTNENAMEMGIEFDLYKQVLNDAINVDYLKLKERTTETIETLEKYTGVIIRSDNHELVLDFEGRTWFKDDGLGDLPAGEVYIAPVSAEGTILVPKVIVEGDVFEDLILTFESGKLVRCSDDKLLEYIQSAPGDSTSIAEYGIGLNDAISQLTGYALFDEKMLGTVHIAVGMNTTFGGNNDTPLHLDFVVQNDVEYKM